MEKEKDYSIKKDNQKRLKSISKCLYILAKIGRVFAIIGIVGLVLAMVIIPAITSNIKTTTKDGQTILKVFDGNLYYERTEHSFKLFEEGKESDALVVTDQKSVDACNEVFKYLEKNDLSNATIKVEVLLALIAVSLLIEVFVLKKVYLFFKNIYDESSPFIKENVDLLRSIAKLLIYSLLVSLATSFVGSIVFKSDVSIQLASVLEVLIAFFLVYIFEYGYKLQDDSKGTIYSKGE